MLPVFVPVPSSFLQACFLLSVVLIHGYNKKSGEIAFTDSWGEKYRERWITHAEASRFSGDNYWVIDY